MKKTSVSKHHNIPTRKIILFSKTISKWGETNSRKFPWRKSNTSIYKRVLTEVLLQRTRAQTVSKIYDSFFRSFPSWKAVDQASKTSLEEHLKFIGLQRRRTVVIKALARELVIKNGRFPRERSEIDALPGVGQYVGNAIELFVYLKPKPLLDANMARVLERFFGSRKLADIRYDPYLQSISSTVIKSADNPITINWAILDFASAVCKIRNPLCSKCVLSSRCPSAFNKQLDDK